MADQMFNKGLEVLQLYKKAIDDAAETIEIAKELKPKLDLFQVTILMIPRRGNQTSTAKTIEEEEENLPEKPKEDHRNFQDYLSNAFSFFKAKAKQEILNQANKIIGDLKIGVAYEFAKDMISGANKESNSDLKEDPGRILDKMRKNGAKDIEISFVAMQFIIKEALNIIKEAVTEIGKVKKINCLLMFNPWEIEEQQKIGQRLSTYFDAIDKFNLQLQSAISIASYCISLEQLENTLDATKVLKCQSIAEFWRQNIGIEHTRVKFRELSELLLELSDKIIKESHDENCYVKEKIMDFETNVLLSRFLGYLLNPNSDDDTTIHELNSATAILAEIYGSNVDFKKKIMDVLLTQEIQFLSKIEFLPFECKDGKDGIKGTEDDTLLPIKETMLNFPGVQLNPKDKVLRIKPFDRIHIRCDLPIFDPNVFEFDFITLLKYTSISDISDPTKALTILKAQSDRPELLTLEEIIEKRTYLTTDANKEVYGNSTYAWNAPREFKPLKASKYFKNKQNFHVILSKTKEDNDEENNGEEENENKIEEDVEEDNTNNNNNKSKLNKFEKSIDKLGIKGKVRLLYTPIIESPGIYTIRYVLDDIEIPENETMKMLKEHHKKKLTTSPKTYYYNKLITEQIEMNTEKLFISKRDFVGESQLYEKYSSFAIRLLTLMQEEFFEDGDLTQYEKCLDQCSKFYKELTIEGKNNIKNPPNNNTFQSNIASELHERTSVTFGSNSMFIPRSIRHSIIDKLNMNEGIQLNPIHHNQQQQHHQMNNDSSSFISQFSKELDRLCPSKKKEIMDYYKNSYKVYKPSSYQPMNQPSFHDITHMKSIQNEFSMKKLKLSFQLKDIIIAIYDKLMQKLKLWHQNIKQQDQNNNINLTKVLSNPLNEASKLLTTLKQLNALYETLIPNELLPALIISFKHYDSETLTTITQTNTIIKPKTITNKRTYLIDPLRNCNKEAKESLSWNIFQQYYQTKFALLYLDAYESTKQMNIRRLEMLSERFVELEKCYQEMFLEIETKAKDEKNMITKPQKILIEQIKTSTSRQEVEKILQLTSNNIYHEIKQTLQQIHQYHDVKFDRNNNKHIMKNTRMMYKIYNECKYYLDQIKYLPYDHFPNEKDDIALTRKMIPKSLGLIIYVENTYALAWGERIIDKDKGKVFSNATEDQQLQLQQQPSSTSNTLPNKEENEEENDEQINYRPMISYKYPFPQKDKIIKVYLEKDINELIEFYQNTEETNNNRLETLKKDIKYEFVLFYNLPKPITINKKPINEEEIPKNISVYYDHIGFFYQNKLIYKISCEKTNARGNNYETISLYDVMFPHLETCLQSETKVNRTKILLDIRFIPKEYELMQTYKQNSKENNKINECILWLEIRIVPENEYEEYEYEDEEQSNDDDSDRQSDDEFMQYLRSYQSNQSNNYMNHSDEEEDDDEDGFGYYEDEDEDDYSYHYRNSDQQSEDERRKDEEEEEDDDDENERNSFDNIKIRFNDNNDDNDQNNDNNNSEEEDNDQRESEVFKNSESTQSSQYSNN